MTSLVEALADASRVANCRWTDELVIAVAKPNEQCDPGDAEDRDGYEDLYQGVPGLGPAGGHRVIRRRGGLAGHSSTPMKNASPHPWPFMVTVNPSEEPLVGTGADNMSVPVLFSC